MVLSEVVDVQQYLFSDWFVDRSDRTLLEECLPEHRFHKEI
jgi:hypothetical protein